MDASVPDRDGPELLRIPLEAFTVADYATEVLWHASPDAAATEAFRTMGERGFDVAPLNDVPVWRYVELNGAPPPDVSVADLATPINVSAVVASTSPLADSVERLRTSPYLFVLSGSRGVSGLVVRADLQRPAVAMVALSLVLATEAAFSQLIVETYRDGEWETSLSEERRAKARDVFDQRKRHKAELRLIDCLMLDDRLTLVRKRPQLVDLLGYSSVKACRRAFKQLSEARDILAHAGDLLGTCPDPVDAIDLFIELRRLAKHSWTLVREVPWYWE